MIIISVDLTDQHLSYYTMTNHRTLKLWKKVFWRLIDITIVNAWIIFRTNHPESSINTQKKFRLDLAENLVQPLLDLMARRPVSTAKRLIGKHFPYKNKKRGRCLVCGDRKTSTGKRKDTKTQNFCPKCDVFLCQGKCFEDYHSRTSYWSHTICITFFWLCEVIVGSYACTSLPVCVYSYHVIVSLTSSCILLNFVCAHLMFVLSYHTLTSYHLVQAADG